MNKTREIFQITRKRPINDETRIMLGNELARLHKDIEEAQTELKEITKDLKKGITKLENQASEISDKINEGQADKEIDVYMDDDSEGRRCFFDAETNEFVDFCGEQPDIEPEEGNLFSDLDVSISEEKQAVIDNQENGEAVPGENVESEKPKEDF